jgi:hypothetical protein
MYAERADSIMSNTGNIDIIVTLEDFTKDFQGLSQAYNPFIFVILLILYAGGHLGAWHVEYVEQVYAP